MTRARTALLATSLLAVAAVAAAVVGLQRGLQHKVYYDLLYRTVASQVTAGATDQAVAIDRLTQFVFQNVHAPDDAPLDEDGPPAETLDRGYGYCDQQVRLFMTLASKVGLQTREMFLIDRVTGTSPHTVVEVKEGGRWALVDVFYGYVARRSDGSPATIADVVEGSDPIIPLTGLKPSDYENARVELAMNPSPLSGVATRLLPGWLADRLQDLYLMSAPPTIPIPAGFSRFKGYAAPDGQLYWRARNHQLFSRVGPAISEYHALLAGYPNTSYANDARYNLSLMASASSPRQSIRIAQHLQTRQPVAALGTDALLLASHDYERLGAPGACLNALRLYQQLAAGFSTAAPAAIFDLNQSPCRRDLPAARAVLGPLELDSVETTSSAVSMLWRMRERSATNYTIFVHALDAQGQVIAQNDAEPTLPTSQWLAGQFVPDSHRLVIPVQTAELEIGAYDWRTAERLRGPDGQDAFRMRIA